MKPLLPLRPAMLLLALCVSGCADDRAGYPSLTQRPYELAEPATPVALPDNPDAGNGEIAAKVAEIAKRAAPALDGFSAAMAASSGDVMRGRHAPSGSEAWVVAQEALSRIDSTRAPVLTALADLDHMRGQAIETGKASDAALIDAAIQELQVLHDMMRDKIAALVPAN